MVYTLDQFVSDGKKNNYTPEQLNTINQERIKKWGVGVPGRETVYNNFNNQKPKEESIGIGGIAGIGAGAIGTSAAIGQGLSSIGKTIYGLGVGETQGQALAQTFGQTPLQKTLGIKPKGVNTEVVKTTPQTALDRGNIFKQTGGAVTRGTTARQTANKIRETSIAPVLESSKSVTNLDSLLNQAKVKLATQEGNKFNIVSKKSGLDEVVTAIKKTYGKDFNLNKLSLKELQDLKSNLYTMDIPKSAFNGAVVKDSYKQGALEFASIVRDRILDIAKQENPKLDVKKLANDYIDYGNLVDLAETSAKKGAINPSQNLQQIISSASGKPVSAASTFIGKTLYKAGELAKTPLKTITNLGKSAIKSVTKGGVEGVAGTVLADTVLQRIAKDKNGKVIMNKGLPKMERIPQEEINNTLTAIAKLPGEKLNQLLTWFSNATTKK